MPDRFTNKHMRYLIDRVPVLARAYRNGARPLLRAGRAVHDNRVSAAAMQQARRALAFIERQGARLPHE